MIEIIKAIIFGIVEGITEWLPISSTGHMILLDEFVKLNVSEDFFEMFLVVIQLGAILAVVVLFIKSIWPFALSHRNPCPVKSTGILSYCRKDIFELWFKIIVACVPAAVVGLLFDEFFESLFYNSICVSIALIVFGIGFIIIENRNKNFHTKINSLSEISYKTALIIGLFQLIAAIFPGTSRSGATILGSLMIGVRVGVLLPDQHQTPVPHLNEVWPRRHVTVPVALPRADPLPDIRIQRTVEVVREDQPVLPREAAAIQVDVIRENEVDAVRKKLRAPLGIVGLEVVDREAVSARALEVRRRAGTKELEAVAAVGDGRVDVGVDPLRRPARRVAARA